MHLLLVALAHTPAPAKAAPYVGLTAAHVYGPMQWDEPLRTAVEHRLSIYCPAKRTGRCGNQSGYRKALGQPGGRGGEEAVRG
ncbi:MULTISPECIES: hypothetical protein [Actinosynnema]|uniref:hypothetical protein n=1 Tax=Actinosynnema TaxID=40566 RepID=UPI0020A41758|nr:hypothetical protein [Actinosynnema pretiosum]MCP2097354.1 hypothetical protein [Actinosynnema pretiosum]